MPQAILNGCEAYFEVDGDGPPLLFMHGGFGGLGTGAAPERPWWLPRLAAHYRVITYDRRSSGRSGTSPGSHTLSQFAQDAAALLRHLGIARAAIWGESAGVAIAATFALEFPELTSALIIGDGAPWFCTDAEVVQRLRDRIGLLTAYGADAAYQARRTSGTVGLNLFSADRPASSAEEERERIAQREAFSRALSAMSRGDRIGAYARELRTYAAYLGFDISGQLAQLTAPTLIIYGTGDTIFPAAGWPALIKAMPAVRYVAFDGAEHGAATEPAALDEIERFLGALPPTGA
jgi:pimeloyl-ACP methyl ester carboxylesterase